MMHSSGMFMMFWMALGTLALIAAAAAIVVWALRTTGQPAGANPVDAEQILRRRYAAGEIDDEEYQRRLAMLRGKPPEV